MCSYLEKRKYRIQAVLHALDAKHQTKQLSFSKIGCCNCSHLSKSSIPGQAKLNKAELGSIKLISMSSVHKSAWKSSESKKINLKCVILVLIQWICVFWRRNTWLGVTARTVSSQCRLSFRLIEQAETRKIWVLEGSTWEHTLGIIASM